MWLRCRGIEKDRKRIGKDSKGNVSPLFGRKTKDSRIVIEGVFRENPVSYCMIPTDK